MELTEKQKEGLNIAVQRHRDGCKYTVILSPSLCFSVMSIIYRR